MHLNPNEPWLTSDICHIPKKEGKRPSEQGVLFKRSTVWDMTTVLTMLTLQGCFATSTCSRFARVCFSLSLRLSAFLRAPVFFLGISSVMYPVRFSLSYLQTRSQVKWCWYFKKIYINKKIKKSLKQPAVNWFISTWHGFNLTAAIVIKRNGVKVFQSAWWLAQTVKVTRCINLRN